MKPNHIFNYLNRTPLHAFALNGGISAVIFEYKKHINEKDNDGNTPLHLAATVCRYKDIESLIQAGADVNSDRNDGKTPLHLTICSGLLENRLKALHLLIERGALINSQDQIGYTPLHIAMKLGDYDVAKELISLGADVLAPSYQKMTPLNLLENKDAVFSFIESIAKLITKTNVLNYFLKFICDCNFGSDCKLYDTIKTLVSCGADINTVLSSKDQNISSVLTLDNPALLRYILENDAGPLSKKISLSTLMKLAIYQ
jgi:ankyrin repeat protein